MAARGRSAPSLAGAWVAVAVLALAAGGALAVGHHLRNGPLTLAGIEGLVVAIGGGVIVADRAQRRTLDAEPDRDAATRRLRGLALVAIPTLVVVVLLAQDAPTGWPRSLILAGFCLVWLPVAALVATRGGR